MKPLRHSRVRVYWTVRTAHLERARQMTPASIVYAGRRYDFDPELADGLDLHLVSVWRLVRLLGGAGVAIVEINEPLMFHGQLRTALAVATVRVTGRLRRRRVRIVSYAIENRDPLVARPTGWKSRLRRVGQRESAGFVASRIDRIVFGTPGAAALYDRLLGDRLAHADRETIAALPAACDCVGSELRDPLQVVFVGTFDARKGLRQLLAAWPHVLTELPEARLSLLGLGPLEADARAFASRPEVRLAVDPPRDVIHRELAATQVLVLASQPTPGWREQVGLPIVEGLAHGATVVTTDQTGLADWLGAHGHEVVPAGADERILAAAIVRALRRQRPATDVRADLPEQDGRVAADDYLMS